MTVIVVLETWHDVVVGDVDDAYWFSGDDDNDDDADCASVRADYVNIHLDDADEK